MATASGRVSHYNKGRQIQVEDPKAGLPLRFDIDASTVVKGDLGARKNVIVEYTPSKQKDSAHSRAQKAKKITVL